MARLVLEFYYRKSKYDITSEYLAYDIGNVIADIGGFLGLLLGYSLFGFYDIAKGALSKYRSGGTKMVAKKNARKG